MEVKVFIVDDDASARRGLARLIKALGYEAAPFDSAAAFLASPESREAGCLLLDVSMPDMTGPELHQQLIDEGRGLPVIFLSACGDVPTVATAMRRGAVHFLTKPVDREDLAKAVREAQDILHQQLERDAGQEAGRHKVAALTPREREVLTYVITGRLNKQIAAELGVTEDTVKIHRSRMMQKLGIYSVAGLIRLCDLVGIEAACPIQDE